MGNLFTQKRHEHTFRQRRNREATIGDYLIVSRLAVRCRARTGNSRDAGGMMLVAVRGIVGD